MRFSWCALFIVIFCSISSCQDDYDIDNLNNNRISVLGHGGMGISHVYPWNSFESIMNSLYLGADGTEIDIQLTKDSVLIAYHDKDLSERTTLSGKVYENTWEDISRASFHKLNAESYTLPSLNQIFTHSPDVREKLFFLDVKYLNPFNEPDYDDIFINALKKLLLKHKLQNNIYIELNNVELIQRIQNEIPDLNILLSASAIDKALELAEHLDIGGIIMRARELNEAKVRKAHQRGIQVTAYATSRSENKKSIEINADHIQTDNLKHLKRILK